MISRRVLQSILLAWYERFGRKDLPWQQPRTPYRVWVSEIMLQQTQVGTVIPYFQRFMVAFPTVQALAAAQLDQLLRYWAGLGYYARARNLHRAAAMLVTGYGGEIPADLEALMRLPGIGRSTAGAIVSLAFNQPAPILDGNVKRLWSRLHGVEDSLDTQAAQRRLWALSEYYLPTERASDYTQALMDFGASVCTRARPRCSDCAFQSRCLAYRTGRVAVLPVFRPRLTKPIKASYWLLLRDGDGRVYLEQQPPTGIWAGLWAPPQWDSREALEEHCCTVGIRPEDLDWLPSRRHGFTHYLLRYTPALVQISTPLPVLHDRPACWLKPKDFSQLAMPAPVRRLLRELL